MKNALLSVYNKDGLVEFASFLAAQGWHILSTGGTAAYLRQAGINLTDVAERTGFAECLDGRVKTLHPVIHAGILARRDMPSHTKTLAELDIKSIDLVCVNLYPFFDKASEEAAPAELTECIDIGGPAMLRSAAKNWRDVLAICDTADYQLVQEALLQGTVDETMRRRLAAKVFNLVSAYDAAISHFLFQKEPSFPSYWTEPLVKTISLRYGENAHQEAALYRFADRTSTLTALRQLGGKELSYNNIRDLDLAWKCVCAFGLEADGTEPLGAAEVRRLIPHAQDTIQPCCVAVKHNTPCGIATGKTAVDAFNKAYSCDRVSIFGGIVAFNVPVTRALASALQDIFLEIVVAPSYDMAALALLQAKKNLRIICMDRAPEDDFEVVSVDGGLLAQKSNRRLLEKWETVTKTAVEPALIPDMLFALRAVTFVRSNGIVIVKEQKTIGIGGGETSRIWATELALTRAGNYHAAGEKDNGAPLILASDAFMPFPDVIEAAGSRKIKAIVQSGGSTGDGAAIETCDKYGIAMVFTGIRCFKH